jgi:hypothetical protein
LAEKFFFLSFFTLSSAIFMKIYSAVP